MGRSASLFGLLGLALPRLRLRRRLVARRAPATRTSSLNLVAGVGLAARLPRVRLRGLPRRSSASARRATAPAPLVYSLLFVALVVGAQLPRRAPPQALGPDRGGRLHALAAVEEGRRGAQGARSSMTAFVEGGVRPAARDAARQLPLRRARRRSRPACVDPDKEPALAEQMKITTVPSVHLQYGKESFVVTQPTEETITNGIIRVTRRHEEDRLLHRGPRRGRHRRTPQDPKGYSQREARRSSRRTTR